MSPRILIKRAYEKPSSQDGFRVPAGRLWPRGLRKAKYLHELKENPAVDDFVTTHSSKKIITLVYAAKDTEHNQALVLQQYLTECFKNAG